MSTISSELCQYSGSQATNNSELDPYHPSVCTSIHSAARRLSAKVLTRSMQMV